MGDIKIVFSDIDGTFLNKESQVTSGTGKAAKALVEKLPFVLVSARMPEAIYPITEEIGIKIPIISYSGALVLTEKEEILYDKRMEGTDTGMVLGVIQRDFPQVTLNYYAGRHWYVEGIDERVQTEMDITSATAEVRDFEEILLAEEMPNKILVMADPEDCERMEAELSEKFPSLHIVRSSAFLLEIMDKSVSKATGIKVMLEHYGIAAEESLAFGDNYNDVEMLELCGRSVAMGNAPEDIKKLADEVTLSNDEDGLAEYLVKNGIIC
ncbi:Cof-type HAD-IIB family hydrolase [Selenomonas sp. AB3002]|uniref:Cof-type HAD-IIB family hydrolase n=1 Tax=Selenomonas sp. AB3002 TaxID=1392502 RepID=UPI000496097B